VLDQGANFKWVFRGTTILAKTADVLLNLQTNIYQNNSTQVDYEWIAFRFVGSFY
jgi:hypothetical protein